MNECPTQSELLKLCCHEIDAEREQVLLEHVDQCAACQAVVERFSDPLVASAQSLAATNASSDSTLLRERLGQLKIQRPSPQPSNAPQHQDLQPWIDEGDTDIGRVDHYDLIRCVGRGGMGVVFEAFDQELQRPVAVKMMSPALLTDPANSQRFLREARAAAAINHPSVVAIYAVSKIRDLPYLVMELVDGESLQERLNADPDLDMESIIGIAADVADGLAAAHEQGIVHRDIKPANILLPSDSDGVKLTDFGLAYSVSENPLTQTGTLLGTPEFLAPEQINGEPIDHRSDLFSLGSVIYQMCVGRPPFTGQTFVSTLREVTNSEPEPLEQINRDIPVWLSELVSHLHAKDPNERIADAHSVSAVLRSRGSRTVRPITTRSIKHGERKSQKLVRIAALVALLLAAALASFLVIKSIFSGQEELLADSSAELTNYLNEHEGDLVIKLISDEPYLLEPLEIEDRSIEIISGDDDESLLLFRLQKEQSAFYCESGQLALRGVRIEVLEYEGDFADDDDDEEEDDIEPDAELELDEDEEEDDEETGEPVIAVQKGGIELDDCEVAAGTRPGIELVKSDALLVETVFETDSLAIMSEPDPRNQLELIDCTMTAEVALSFPESACGKLHISGSAFESDYAVEFSLNGKAGNNLEIEATNTRFECDAVIGVYDVENVDAATSGNLPFLWTGSKNELPSTFMKLFTADEDIHREISSAAWRELLDARLPSR